MRAQPPLKFSVEDLTSPSALPFFVPTIFTVERSDVVLTVPRRLGRITASTVDVRIVEPPHEIRGFSYFMTWHPRLTKEPEHAWFRDQLRMTAQGLRKR